MFINNRKNYKIEVFEDIITTGKTGLISDKITVEGLPVGYMVREEPIEEDDSGWRFYSGTEDEDFVEDEENFMVFDLNTIANYDKAILPYLKKSFGTEWERNDYGKFKEIKD